MNHQPLKIVKVIISFYNIPILYYHYYYLLIKIIYIKLYIIIIIKENNNVSIDKIINIIKNNTLPYIKVFFKENYLMPSDYDNYEEIVHDLIKNNVSIEKINFIIEQRNPKFYGKLLFYCLKEKNLEMANILYDNKIRNINDMDIDKNNKNIVEYLLKDNSLTSENLKFILDRNCNPNLITGKVMCSLIREKKIQLLPMLYYHQFNETDFNNNFILNFLIIYKNHTPLTNDNIKELMSNDKPVLLVNSKDEHNCYALLIAIKTNIFNIIKSIFDYAENNNIILEINDKDNNKNFPLLQAVEHNDIKSVNLLENYAINHDIILKINEGGEKEGNNPFLLAVKENNEEILNSLIEYGEKTKLVIDINKLNNFKDSSLFWAIYNNNINIVQKLINYADNHGIVLNINQKNEEGEYPLLQVIINGNSKILSLIFEYAEQHNIILNIDDQNQNGNYPLLNAIDNEDIKTIKMLFDYAEKYNIIIDMNKINKFGNCSLLLTIDKNNEDLVKLIINYAEHHYQYNKKLDIYKVNKSNNYPFKLSIEYNNINIIKSLITYANKHYIPLETDIFEKFPRLKEKSNYNEIFKLFTNPSDTTISVKNKPLHHKKIIQKELKKGIIYTIFY